MIGGISRSAARHVGTNRFTKFGVLVTIAVVLAGSTAQLVNYEFFVLRIRSLDPGSDSGVFGVIGDIALAAAAVSAWVLAARAHSARPVAAALATLLTFLAADDVTRLHDSIPDWLAFYLPVLAASFICLVAVSRGPSGRPRFRADRGAGRAMDRLIGVGLLLLTFSFVLHLLGVRLLVYLGADTTGFAYQAKAAVKHATESAGWFLIALGLLRLNRDSRREPEGLELWGSDLRCARRTRCYVIPVRPSNAFAGESTHVWINAS